MAREFDDSDWIGKEETIASAATCDIGAFNPARLKVLITGTVAITSFGTAPGKLRFLRFAAALVLTHNATSLILQTGANITTAAGDTAIAVSDEAGNWRVFAYQRASGQALAPLGLSIFPPQGRLTLTTAVPYLASDVSAAATLYYTPALGALLPIYDGSKFVMTSFSEVSQALSDTTKSPAAAVADTLYDVFGWLDSGTFRISRGPLWDDSGAGTSSRGTGAGKTELERVNGLLVNKVAITNGPAARRGIYLGTILTDAGGATLSMQFLPSAAAGGSDNRLGVWNAFNRRSISAVMRESTDSWTYTTATWRQMNNSAANKITFAVGLAEGRFVAHAKQRSSNTTVDIQRYASIGLDSATAPTAGAQHATVMQQRGGCFVDMDAFLKLVPAAGRHYVAPLEYAVASGAVTWHGDGGGSTLIQCGIDLEIEM